MAPVDPQKSPPTIMLFKDLHHPVDLQRARLQDIQAHFQMIHAEGVLLQGIFVLAFSGLETMLSDIYRYFLQAMPDAFQFQEEKVSRAALAANTITQDIISRRIDRHVNDMGYDRFASFLKRVLGTLKLCTPQIDTALIDRLVEAKETRNLLLHNDLRVNRQYLDRAGAQARATDNERGGRLPLPRDYVAAAIADASRLVEEVRSRLHRTYASYTKLKAFRELWSYLFNTPLMKFEDYWELDEVQDKVLGIKIYDRESRLSNSERMFLGVLREHITSRKHSEVAVNMTSLDHHSQERMLYLLRLLGRHRF